MQDPWGKAFLARNISGRDGVRTPLPWAARRRHAGIHHGEKRGFRLPDAHAARAVDVQDSDPQSVLSFLCAAWLAWRRDTPMLAIRDRGRWCRQTIVAIIRLYDRADASLPC